MVRTISIIILGILCCSELHATDIRSKLQKVYTSQIGIIEITNRNDGKAIREYLGTVGLEEGNMYCAAFVNWCFEQVGIISGMTGWSATCCPEDKLVYKKGSINKTEPQQGSVFWWKRGAGGHTGFIDRWGKNHAFTVEGNVTGEDGIGGVQSKIRPIGRILLVADHIPEDTTQSTEPEQEPKPDPYDPEVSELDKVNPIKLLVVAILIILAFKKNE